MKSSPAARDPRRRDRDDLPGSDDLAEPGPLDREAARRSRPAAQRRLEEGGAAAGASISLEEVGIPRAERRIDDYPHQFSGGMRQRVMIAMAMINDPALLIADEPTTALDVTTQAQILTLMRSSRRSHGTAIIMITHDLGVVAEIADDVVVMYAAEDRRGGNGRLDLHAAPPPVHVGPARLAAAPRRRCRAPGADPRPAAVAAVPPRGCRFHPRCPYVMDVCRQELPELARSPATRATRRRASSTRRRRSARPPACWPQRWRERGKRRWRRAPRRREPQEVLPGHPGDHLPEGGRVREGGRRRHLHASSAARRSASSASRAAASRRWRAASCACSTRPAGQIVFDGRDITRLSRAEMRPIRREMMMIFQDPYASLNPRKRVGFIVAEALEVHKVGTDAEIKRRVQELLEIVGPQPRALQPLSARVLGRPAPADRRRPRARRQPEADRLRRARLRARRLRPGADPQPAQGPAARVRPHLHLHRARPQRRPPHLRPRHGHVPRARSSRSRSGHGALHGAEAPVHRRAALRGADPEPGARPAAAADRARGRRPEPDQPAGCVPLPPALPALRRGPLRRRRAAAPLVRRRPEAACHFPLERWPMTADEMRAAAARVRAGARPGVGRGLIWIRALAAAHAARGRTPLRDPASGACCRPGIVARLVAARLSGARAALGRRSARSRSGFYFVGAFLLIAGFFFGNRGPARLRGEPERGSVRARPRRGVRMATPEERADAVSTTAGFIVARLRAARRSGSSRTAATACSERRAPNSINGSNLRRDRRQKERMGTLHQRALVCERARGWVSL